MTKYIDSKVKCNSCGNITNMELYDSVNITVDPELLNKVKNRQINNFTCKKCGTKSELAYHFLFHNMNPSQLIWVYPENDRMNKDEIEKQLKSESKVVTKLTSNLGMADPIIVYGYDELFKLIS